MENKKKSLVRLEEYVEQWLSMPVDAADPQMEAENYYREKIFPLVKELFREKEGAKLEGKNIYGLILTVGTSPEPLVLSISACCPERVLFLYTPETEKHLDEIVKLTGLEVSQLEKWQVRDNDPLSIYQAVMQAWENWARHGDVGVDITGGTKSMAGGLAMAGALLGFQLFCVATDNYLGQRRRPRPGSEYLELLPNPYSVFGILEEKKVEELFRRQDYHGASRSLSELVEKVPDPRKFQALYSLSRAYEEWDVLNIKEAVRHLQEAVKQVKRLEPFAELARLEEQINRLEHLSRLMPQKPEDPVLELLQDIDAVETLVFTVYLNATRMQERGKLDSAALYLYRLLEVMEQRRLALYGINTSTPDYGCLQGITLESLLKQVNGVREKLNHYLLEELPSEINLTDGYMILEALGDPFQLQETQPKPIHWRRFLNETKKRNYSILAHGFIFVSPEQFDEFKEMVDSLLELFCRIEGIDNEAALETYCFISDPFKC